MLWKRKYFKTVQAMQNFIIANRGKIQWHEIFVNNRYCVEYRNLRVIRFE